MGWRHFLSHQGGGGGVVRLNDDHKGASLWYRTLVIPILFVTNIIATILLVLNTTGWSGSATATLWIDKHRTIAGMIVQVVSSLLGTLLTLSLTTMINLEIRERLVLNGLRLIDLKFANILTNLRIDGSLRSKRLSAVLIFMLFTIVPATLWSGALTPVITSRRIRSTIDIPRYDNTYGFNNTFLGSSSSNLFTFNPHLYFAGIILNNARSVAMNNGTTPSHSKLDQTGYTYRARSFGAGAVAGFNDTYLPYNTAYQYSELGLSATVECDYNYSSAYHLEPWDTRSNWSSYLYAYTARGMLPNGVDPISIVTAIKAAGGSDTTCAMGAGSANGRHHVAFAAPNDGQYQDLNNITCQISYKPWLFDVMVDISQRTIEVHPTQSTNDFRNSDLLASTITNQLHLLAQVFGASQRESVLCASLQNILYQPPYQFPTKVVPKPLEIAHALESIVDSMLESISAAQYMAMRDRRTVEANITTPAFVLGTRPHIVAIFVLNAVISILVLAELCRTRLWKYASSLNPMDITDVISASIEGEDRLLSLTEREEGKFVLEYGVPRG
ncbi:hypothetical protein F4775DRAFT_387031 [Biscogniauxia sp. FL1348]|nr:hypothetical protein F4775DRAFT_387031 [Biscogniauxia sp. FL1348]